MSDGATQDFARYYEALAAEIRASGRSREQLLDDASGALSELRHVMTTYKQLRDKQAVTEVQYTFAAQDLEEYEATYEELAGATVDAFERDDYVELLANIRTRMHTMTENLQRFVDSVDTSAAAPAPAPAPATRNIGGCTSTLVLLIVLAVVLWIAMVVLR